MRTCKYLLLCLMAAVSINIAAQRQKPVAVRVATFNIRNVNKSDGQNNWELRFQKVGNFLKKSKADIIGLQEVKQLQLDDIDKLLDEYDGIGVGRDDGKQKGEYNPIFYNRNKYSLLESGTFWLSPTPEQPSRGWDAACNRIATWGIFQNKETNKSILVVNTHLDHVGQQARINGATFIKEQVGRMVNELPVLITGDFNVDDTDPVYSKVLTGIFPLRDVWKEAPVKKGPNYTFQGFGRVKPENAKKIDFIFVSSQFKIKSAVIADSSLGDGFYLSDHNAHFADLIY